MANTTRFHRQHCPLRGSVDVGVEEVAADAGVGGLARGPAGVDVDAVIVRGAARRVVEGAGDGAAGDAPGDGEDRVGVGDREQLRAVRIVLVPAGELVGLGADRGDGAAPPAGAVDAVHDDGGHRLHAAHRLVRASRSTGSFVVRSLMGMSLAGMGGLLLWVWSWGALVGAVAHPLPEEGAERPSRRAGMSGRTDGGPAPYFETPPLAAPQHEA